MRTAVRHTAFARAAIAALALVLLLPAVVAAHAELETSSPANGDTVEGTPTEITADFTDTLASESTLELRDAGGTVIAEGAIDPDDDQRMTIDPPDLEPGEYEIRWQAFAEDGHLEVGTYGFTVTAAATPPPTPSAPPSAAATATASPTAVPSTAGPSPEPSAGATPIQTEPTTSVGDVLIPILVAVFLLGMFAAYLRRRRAVPPT